MTAHAITPGNPASNPPLAETASTFERLALSAEEVADVLGISRAHVFRLASSGRLLRSVRLGRAVRWDRTTLEAWLAAGAPTRDRWEEMQNDSRHTRPSRTRR